MQSLKYVAVVVAASVIGIFIGRSTVTSGESRTDHTDDAPSLQANKSNSDSVHNSSNLVFNDKSKVYSSLFSKSHSQNFKQLANTAAESEDDIDKSIFLELLVAQWASKDPAAALAFAKEKNNSHLMYTALRSMGQNDYEGALVWIKENVKDLTMHGYLMTGVFQGLAKEDPANALKLATQLRKNGAREQIVSATLDEWAKQDIEAVFDWIENAEFSQQTPHLYDQVMYRYIQDSPAKAAELVSVMGPGAAKANFASNVAFGLASEDVEAAKAWVQTLSGEEKQFALGGLLDQWASSEDGISSLDFVLQQSDEPAYNNLFTKVAMKLSLSNPEELETKISTLGENEQATVATQLAQVYSENDPDRAKDLINSLDEGKVKDAAIDGSLHSFRYNDLPAAFELTEIYSDQENRIQKMQQVMLDWFEVDPVSAEAALTTTVTIPEDQKETMLNYVRHKVKPREEYLLPEK